MKWHIILLLVVALLPIATAQNLDAEISDEDQQAFNNILTPQLKIYKFIKDSSLLTAADCAHLSENMKISHAFSKGYLNFL